MLRLAELLGALSLTTDLGAGVPFEKGLRTCVVASLLAERLELGLSDRRAAYHASLLRSLGCTAHAPTFAAWFDDDVAIQRELKTLDLDDPEWAAEHTARVAHAVGPARARAIAEELPRTVASHGTELARGSCEVSRRLGEQLELPEPAIAALDEVYERYDGHGFPVGLASDELTIAARVMHVAERAVLAHYDGGPRAAVAEVRRRSGGQLDPAVCEAFVELAEEIADEFDRADVLTRALELEPPPQRTASTEQVDRVSLAFGTFADLKGRYLLGHSAHVAGLARHAAQLSGLDAQATAALSTSGMLLDLGRVGISSAIWDRAGGLGQAEWERVRLHTYWTERILGRCHGLQHLASGAGAHHERLDGSGYHRGARAGELSRAARLLAAADVFAALAEPRPHRPAMSSSDAAMALTAEVRADRIDAEAAGAVIEAAGLPRPRIAWPNDLTDREVEVLRVLVRGLSNRQIADELIVSPRTVQHHLASIYDKINLRTRAGAAVFAIEQGLIPTSLEAAGR